MKYSFRLLLLSIVVVPTLFVLFFSTQLAEAVSVKLKKITSTQICLSNDKCYTFDSLSSLAPIWTERDSNTGRFKTCNAMCSNKGGCKFGVQRGWAGTANCNEEKDQPTMCLCGETPEPPSPPTISISADRTTIGIREGGKADPVLSWLQDNATSVKITWTDTGNRIINAQSSGTARVLIDKTTTFTITALGPGGTATADVTVTVVNYPIIYSNSIERQGGLHHTRCSCKGKWECPNPQPRDCWAENMSWPGDKFKWFFTTKNADKVFLAESSSGNSIGNFSGGTPFPILGTQGWSHEFKPERGKTYYVRIIGKNNLEDQPYYWTFRSDDKYEDWQAGVNKSYVGGMINNEKKLDHEGGKGVGLCPGQIYPRDGNRGEWTPFICPGDANYHCIDIAPDCDSSDWDNQETSVRVPICSGFDWKQSHVICFSDN